jgi:hypothetical protein
VYPRSAELPTLARELTRFKKTGTGAEGAALLLPDLESDDAEVEAESRACQDLAWKKKST